MKRLIRVHEAADNRCLGNGANGQCPFAQEEGSDYCIRHGGSAPSVQRMKDYTKMYRLKKWMSRAKTLGDSLSLRAEVGILRMALEELLDTCDNAATLIIKTAQVINLTNNIRALVVDTKKLEFALKDLLDKNTIIRIATRIVQIVSEHVTDPQVLKTIGEAIEATILEETEIE